MPLSEPYFTGSWKPRGEERAGALVARNNLKNGPTSWYNIAKVACTFSIFTPPISVIFNDF